MPSYILRRLLLMIPTLFGILLVNFIIVQAAPGGPVEQTISRLRHSELDATSRITGMGASDVGANQAAIAQGNAVGSYRGAQGLDPQLIKDIEKMYGFDKPAGQRFWIMLNNYIHFDLGKSFFRDDSVLSLVLHKLPVSITLGLWTTLLMYIVSIPLGIRKAVKSGSAFDVWTSVVIIIGYSIPSFLFGILLIILFGGGSYWHLFPLRGLLSDQWAGASFRLCATTPACVADYFWHIALPVAALVVGGFATLTMLTRNSFLDEISKHYVMTARAKGLSERDVLMKHVFRNAMLIVIAGFPGALLRILFTGAFLIEVIFSLDGMGLLSFEAVLNRDYPVIFGTLYVFTLIGLFFNLLSDLTYMLVDPRIDFARRDA